MGQGLHVVSKRKAGRPLRWYVYAWRGGPLIHKAEGPRPKITAAIADAAAEARAAGRDERAVADTLARLIERFIASPEFGKLASSTKKAHLTWLPRIKEKFGAAPLKALDDRRMKADVVEWRDGWADKPRSADAAMQTFSRLLSWGVERGYLERNIVTGVSQLYEADRSEVIWEADDFERFAKHATVEVNEGVALAAFTGLRRGDLVKLPWSAIGEHAIVWRTAKSRGKNLAAIPLMPEAKTLLQRIRDRHAREMEARKPEKRAPLSATVLSNSRWRPWTAMGFGSRFNDAKVAAGLGKHLHDLRGTFVTRCCIAGLNDREIADIVGWDTKDIAAIRIRYADQARVVVAIGERLARVAMAGPSAPG